ncbi:MAG: sigma-70 family RNA polymerase sigma factor [Bacteroidales bacterium]|nr:sigma-70 family RNA polymerase sigma factor [Bacteroidales bacterium]
MSQPSEPDKNTTPEKWVELYGDYLYNYAFSRINKKDLSYDLVQETFLAALSARKSFEGRSSEKTWLTSILKRKIVDHYRKEFRNKEHHIIDKNFSEEKEDLPFYSSGEFQGHWRADRVPKDWHIRADEALENEELRKIIELCISVLPEKWAAVFTLRIIEELASEDVCKELEITASNLWVILHRAKLQLRDCVEKNLLK